MFRRSPSFRRVVAEILLWTTTATSVWAAAPPVHRVARAFQARVGGPERAAPRYAMQAGSAIAAPIPFFGPTRYTRTAGPPNVYTATVSAPAWLVGPYTLHVQNGEPNGDSRISSARIEINGQSVAGPSDFNQNVAGFDRTVTLTATSTLKVTLTSKPNSYLTLTIGGTNGDRTAPQAAITAPVPASVIGNASPLLTVTYGDAKGVGEAGASGVDLSTLKVTLDGQDRTALFVKGATSATAPLEGVLQLADGMHAIAVTIRDVAGNQGSASGQFRVDRSTPTVTIGTPATGAYLNAGSVSVTGTLVDDGWPVAVTVNGSPASVSSGSFSTTVAAPDGRLDLHVAARDAAGNESTADTWVVVDTQAPVLDVTGPAAGFVSNTTSVRVTGTVADASPVTLRVNGDSMPVANGAFSTDTLLSGEGERTIELVAEDRAGNRTTTSAAVVVDLSAPAIQISKPADQAFVATASPAVQIDWSDSIGVVPESMQVLLDGQDVTNQFTASATGASGTLAALSDAPHQIVATVRDRGANMGTAATSFTVDTTAPEIVIAQPASHEFTNATSIAVSGTVTDASAVTVTVNGAATPLDNVDRGSFTAPAVPVGEGPTRPIMIVAVDAAGNRREAIVTLHVDRAPPAVQIDGPPANAFLKGPIVDVTGSVSDASPIAAIDVNGVAATLVGASFSVQIPVTDGAFPIRATARDAASNASVSEISVTVDSAPPAISVSSPADGHPTNESTVTVTGMVSDTSPTTLRMTTSAGSIPVTLVNGTFTESVALGPEGPNTIALVAIDPAGNRGTLDVHVTRDLTPPTLEIAGPAAGSVLGAEPVSVTGFVYDLTETTVRVIGSGGAPASRVQDSWTALASFGAEGPQTISVAAVDAAGNQSTATRAIVLDLNPPVVTIEQPAGGTLTASGTVTVSGRVADVSLASVVVAGQQVAVPSGSANTPFSATVDLVDGDNHVHVVATDALGRPGEAEVVLTRDSIAPSIQVAAPDTISRRRGAQATVTASDNLGLAQIVVTANGAPLGTFTAGSFGVDLTVPETLAIGASLLVTATAVDRAGNSTTATHALRVIADGVLVGQALDDSNGLPLPGATVRMNDRTTQTDERGAYSLPAVDINVLVTITKAGMTTVERLVPVQSGVGTAVVDARLTPLAEPQTVAPGGTVTASSVTASAVTANPKSQTPNPVSITIPSGAPSLRLTALSPQGLPALLPLGWSPLAAFDLRSPAPIADLAADVTLSGDVPASTDPPAPLPASVHLVRFSPSLHAWVMVAPGVPVTDGRVTVNVSTGSAEFDAFALVVADEMDPPIAIAAANEPLTGVEVMLLPATATSAGAVTPSTLPPAGGIATGVLGVRSPSPLPSGTIVQAQVTETFTLVSGATASEETRSQDIVLYRSPVASSSIVQGFTPALSAYFPITPTRTFEPAELAEGHVHLDILAGREAVRGQTGGSEPLSLSVGDVTFIVPAHALPDDTAIRVQPAVLSTFLPAGADLQPLAEVVVDLSGSLLSLAAELSIPLAAVGAVNELDRFLLGRVERIDGVPHVAIVGLAAVVNDRLVSRAASGLPGVTIGGRYVFYRASAPFAFIGATTNAAGTPVSAIVSTDRWPFIARGDGSGRATVVAPEGATQVNARVPGTALTGSANATLVADQLTAVTVALGGTATTASVTPADGSIAFPPTSQIEITTTAAIATASVESAVVRLLKGDTNVAIRLVLAGSGRTLAVVPQARLEAGVRYQLDVAGLVDVYGGAIAVPPVGFTTASEAVPSFDRDALVVSFPDEDGIVHVTAPAGSLQPGTGVLIVNAGSGEVVSFTALNDGSLQGQLAATIDHRLMVTITDPQGKTTTFERSEYVAPDGTTGIGAGGGTVEGEGGIELRVPEGAVDEGMVLKIEPFDIATMEERPALPGARFGSGIRIGSTSEQRFKKEVDLAFPIPADAPANPKDAFYYVYRRIDGPNGQVMFETIDYARVEGEGADARVVTASYPFTGYKDGWNRWDPLAGSPLRSLGFGQVGMMSTCIAMVFWIHQALLPGAPVGGVITGRVLRPRFEPGSTAPVYDGVPNVLVRRDDTQDPSATMAFTQGDGRFTIFDPHFTTGVMQLRAEAPEGTFTATTYAVAGLDTKLITDDALNTLIGQGTFKNVATANITLPPSQPLPPAPQVTIRLFTETDGVRHEVKGLVIAGTPLIVGFSAKDGTVTGAIINEQEFSVHEDPKRGQASANGMDAILDDLFTPAQPGSYTITGTAMPAFGTPVNASLSIRVIAAGGGTHTSVPGRPGVLSVAPRRDAKGVPVSSFIDVAFTEPVTGVTEMTVRLEEVGGPGVVMKIAGVGLVDGQPVAVDDVSAGHVVTSLTLMPIVGLQYNKTYRVVLTPAIVDRDTDADGLPAPQPLVEFNSTFTTFGPEALGGSADTPRAAGLVVLGDRAYIAETLHTGGTGGSSQFTNLRVYDVANPAAPEEIPPETWINYPPRDIAGEETDEGLTKTVVVATAPRTWFFLQGELIYYYEIRSTSSNLFVYDVSSDPPKWVGAVSLTDNLVDGTPNRIVMKDGMIYAATMNKGIQVVDVQTAKNGFPATGVSDRDFTMFKRISDGGVNKEAIVNTIPVMEPADASPGSGYHLPLTDLEVDDFVVDHTSRRLVLATGPRKQIGLVIVDPTTGETLWRGEVSKDGQSIDWSNAIATANIDGHPLALVGGYGAGGNLLAVVDLSPLAESAVAAPAVLAFVALSHTVGDILVKGNTAIVSGGQGAVGPDGQPGVATLVDLTIPAAARIAGMLSGVGSRTALMSGNLLVSTERSFIKGQTTPLGGVRTAALERMLFLAPIEPTVVRTVAAPSPAPGQPAPAPPPVVETVAPRPVRAYAIGFGEVLSATFDVIENGIVKTTQVLASAASTLAGEIQKGTRFVKNAAASAMARITTRDGEFASAPKQIALGEVTLTVDANNDTELTNADETAKREGKAWAFWEADPGNIGSEDGLVDLATIRLTLKVPVKNLRIRLRGSRATTTWSLSRKVNVPDHQETKAYLKYKPQTQMLFINAPAENCTLPIFHCTSEDGVPITVSRLPKGTHEFLFRCEKCPRDETRLLEIEYAEDPADPSVLDAAKTDIRPLKEWVSAYSARQPGTRSPSPVFQPVNGWWDIPSNATELTLVVHGFNVPEESATNRFIPTYVKRLYWTGHPVLNRQETADGGTPHVLGIVWPGDEHSRISAATTVLYFPEDEFHALQTGVPLAALLSNDFVRFARDGTVRRINIIAHSLGNMAVSSALMWLPPGVVQTYIMNEAAVPAEAFVADYQYSDLERRHLFPHAAANGFADDAFWVNEWRNEMQQPRFVEDDGHTVELPSLKELWEIGVNNQWKDGEGHAIADGQPMYDFRWRQSDRPYPIPPMEMSGQLHRGPWLGFFAGNRSKIARFVNTYNRFDQALRIDQPLLDFEMTNPLSTRVYAWFNCQLLQKPNVGLFGVRSDNKDRRFWGHLGVDLRQEEYLWRDTTGLHFNITRQWAELAHWFPSRSQAAGTGALAVADSNRSFTTIGGDDSDDPLALFNVRSHGYMTGKKIWEVWFAFEQIRDELKVR